MQGRPDEVSKESCAAPRDLFGFTTFGQLFERIGAYRLD